MVFLFGDSDSRTPLWNLLSFSPHPFIPVGFVFLFFLITPWKVGLGNGILMNLDFFLHFSIFFFFYVLRVKD